MCHCMSLHVCPGEKFISDSNLAICLRGRVEGVGIRNCPFGLLLVVF